MAALLPGVPNAAYTLPSNDPRTIDSHALGRCDIVRGVIGLEVPVVQAPMAGGPSTPALAAAVSDAGGLGFLAAGHQTPAAVLAEITATRELTRRPFGVNVFAPPDGPADPGALHRYAARLRSQADALDVAPGDPRFDDDHYQQKVDLLVEQRVAVVSFTFGCPAAAVLQRLRQVGTSVWVTVTDPQEAALAAAAGADALVVQGVEAGGHRGSFLDTDDHEDYGVLALLSLVADRVDLPLVAAGGIATGSALAGVLAGGATAGAVGTGFLRCPEAGTAAPHREAVGQRRRTGLTRAFSGRLARGLVNTFQAEHTAAAPSAYPELHHLTTPLRARARADGDAEQMSLWAGQAHELAAAAPAGQVVVRLATEAAAALDRAGRRLSPATTPRQVGQEPPTPPRSV
jgi:nitronate monooxygenase